MSELKYGMKILCPCHPVMLIPMLGIAMTSSDSPIEMVEMQVCKYWETDTDANAYKVKLKPVKPVDILRFGNECFYSMDLRSLIKDGVHRVVEDKVDKL